MLKPVYALVRARKRARRFKIGIQRPRLERYIALVHARHAHVPKSHIRKLGRVFLHAVLAYIFRSRLCRTQKLGVERAVGVQYLGVAEDYLLSAFTVYLRTDHAREVLTEVVDYLFPRAAYRYGRHRLVRAHGRTELGYDIRRYRKFFYSRGMPIGNYDVRVERLAVV